MQGCSSELQVSTKLCHPGSFSAAITAAAAAAAAAEGINRGLILQWKGHRQVFLSTTQGLSTSGTANSGACAVCPL